MRTFIMVDLAVDSGKDGQKEFPEVQSTSSSVRAWVKPSFERLSLKDALSGGKPGGDGTGTGS